MLAEAPGLFSTATGWPSPSVSLLPSSLHSTSLDPPGGKGATNLIGREGYVWAWTVPIDSARKRRRRRIAASIVLLKSGHDPLRRPPSPRRGPAARRRAALQDHAHRRAVRRRRRARGAGARVLLGAGHGARRD